MLVMVVVLVEILATLLPVVAVVVPVAVVVTNQDQLIKVAQVVMELMHHQHLMIQQL